MNKMLRNGAYLLIVILISGCTTLSTNIKNTKKEIIGTNIDGLFNKWGAPSSRTPLPSLTGVVYMWNNGGCKNNVTANNDGVITNYTANGNCSFLQWK